MVDELGFIWVCPYDPARHGFALGDLGGSGYVFLQDGASWAPEARERGRYGSHWPAPLAGSPSELRAEVRPPYAP